MSPVQDGQGADYRQKLPAAGGQLVDRAGGRGRRRRAGYDAVGLEKQMPGLERVLRHRPEGASPVGSTPASTLWTARRIAARAIARLPEVSE